MAAVNPEVHRVQGHYLGPGLHLVENVELEPGFYVCQKEVGRLAVPCVQPWREIREDVKLRIQRLPGIQVLGAVDPGPAKRFAVTTLQAGYVHVMGLQQLDMLIQEVVANYCHQANRGEVAARDGKVHRRAAKGVSPAADRRADRVICDRTDYQNTHIFLLPLRNWIGTERVPSEAPNLSNYYVSGFYSSEP